MPDSSDHFTVLDRVVCRITNHEKQSGRRVTTSTSVFDFFLTFVPPMTTVESTCPRLRLANNALKEEPLEKVDIVRRRIARALEKLVAKYIVDGLDNSDSSQHGRNRVALCPDKKIDLLSRVLEAALYKKSKSIEEYADFNTLEARFHFILSRCHMHGTTYATRRDYHRLLCTHVGKSLYEKIQSASRELQYLRQTSSVYSDVLKERMTWSDNKTQQACAADVMPVVLQKLYFNNRLLRAVGCFNIATEVVESKRIISTDWQELVDEADSIIQGVGTLKKLYSAPSTLRCCTSMCNKNI